MSIEMEMAPEAVMPGDLVEEGDGKLMQREDPDPHEARRNLVTKIIENIKDDKAFFADRFEHVDEDAKFGMGIQWEGATTINNDGKYTANIVNRHIDGKVSALYAKNPTVVATRRKRLEYEIWDGKAVTLQMAQQAMTMAGQTQVLPDLGVLALIQDIANGMEAKRRADRIAKTLELVYKHYQDNQPIPFKDNLKALVRRVVTVGWGYTKIDFEREMHKNPETATRMADIETRLDVIKRLNADLHDGEFSETDAEAEELRLTLKALQEEPDVIKKEGLTWLFPDVTSIIPHKAMKRLKGFVGCDWVTEEFLLTKDDVKEIYDVDLGHNFTSYNSSGVAGTTTTNTAPHSKLKERNNTCDYCIVWVTSNIKTGLVYTTCDGHKDFLEEPRAPNVKLARFWTIFPLVFNQIEPRTKAKDCHTGVIPPSDVRLLMSIQREYNRSRHGLREHRKANRPKTASPAGMLSEADKKKMVEHPANAHIELQSIQPGQNVNDVIQAIKGAPIDAALYDTSFLMEDFMRVGGSQEANIGGTSGATATEASIGEGSRVSGLSSNSDDLDDLLTDLARASGEVLLMELSPEKAKEIAGPGAVWPQMTRQEAANEIMLEIVAGSSGRPNQDKEAAKLERLGPAMQTVPGISPEWLAAQYVQRLDDKVDLEEALLSGMPSMSAINALASAAQTGVAASQTANGGGAPNTGDQTTDPAAQAPAGAANGAAPAAPGGVPMASGMAPNTGAPPMAG